MAKKYSTFSRKKNLFLLKKAVLKFGLCQKLVAIILFFSLICLYQELNIFPMGFISFISGFSENITLLSTLLLTEDTML